VEGHLTVIEQELENVNSRTVQLVKLLTEVGPDIPEISRRLGQFKESVRYRYKEKIVNRGFAVQAAVDHDKLGLRRLMLVVEVSEPYRNYAQAIFAAMHELCYVVGFTKTLVGGEHVINLSVPADQMAEVREFFQGLKEKGMFSSLEMHEFDWFRITPMKAEFYDFDTGRWDFDWQKVRSEDFESAVYAPSSASKFDHVDLLIIKELQMDANKSLKEIADKLGINYKKLAWHHTTHVLARGLIPKYTVNWMGTRYDYTLEKALHRKHRYFAVDVFVRNVSELELMTLRKSIDGLPFLWGEAGGRDYFAEFAFPVDNVVESLQYLGNIMRPVRDRMSIYPIDQTEAARFTIPYKLYDESTKRWAFDRNELSLKFDQLMVQIKEGIS
jgi:DNA-binding Lrp family transcriptional regulator